MQTVRLAPPAVAARFPLPVTGVARWEATTSGYRCEVELPPLAPGELVVPSLAFDDLAYGFDVAMEHEGLSWELAPIGHPHRAVSDPDPRVRTHIDYFAVHAPIEHARLRFSIYGHGAPERYLLCVSVRPASVEPEPGASQTPRLAVPALSQLTAPRGIRRRICSPACVTMVLMQLGRSPTLAQVVADCHHAPSQMYGVWPLALRAAARYGLIGAVEIVTSMASVEGFLDRGVPVVASIRFEAGALAGAPLSRTDGHLVVITGLDAHHVHVNDPAARHAGEVPRSYDRAQFTAAWLGTRGAAYLFCAPEQTA